MKSLTIIGSGATAMAAAYHFTKQGTGVLMCDTEERSSYLQDIQRMGGIRLSGVYEEEPRICPECVTHDFEKAMAHSELILFCVSSDRQKELAEQCAPYLSERHSILLSPGNLGSLEIRPVIGTAIQIGELSDNLCPCRMTGEAEVLVGLPFGTKRAAAYPAADTEALIERWKEILPLSPGKNIFETALNSPNVISHVGGSVLNTAAIEKADGHFAFFLDGLSPAVIQVMAQAEKERNQVLEYLGLDAYNQTAPLLNALMAGPVAGFEVFAKLEGPENFEHRYISEDACCGVALLISLAKEYQLPAAVTEAVTTLAGCINSQDYVEQGRTLQHYGLNGYSKEELIEKI